MDKYRDDNLEKHIEGLNTYLQAIAGNEPKNLDSYKNLQRDDVANIDEATIMAMKKTANTALVHLTALAVGFDRVLATFKQAIQEMDDENMPNAHRYKNRLVILTNFEKIVEELTPPKQGMSRAACYGDEKGETPEE